MISTISTGMAGSTRCWPKLRPNHRRAYDVIRYSSRRVVEHEFEAWFSNSAAYDAQRKRRLVECPTCGSTKVHKQIMAPAIPLLGEGRAARGDRRESRGRNPATYRNHATTMSATSIADEARAMYYGETEHRPVWGEVTPDVAQELVEEGVPAMPLPKPFAPEPPKRKSRAN